MPEQKVKTVSFYVCKKAQKLIGYHSNVSSTTAKIDKLYMQIVLHYEWYKQNKFIYIHIKL